MGHKADYVKDQAAKGHDGTHTCHYPGCGKPCAPAFWGCRSCWFKLPDNIRKKIWRTYRPGQENDKDASVEYLAAAQEAHDWVMANDEKFKRQGSLF